MVKCESQQEGVAVIEVQAQQLAVPELHRLESRAIELGIAEVAVFKNAVHKGKLGQIAGGELAMAELAVFVFGGFKRGFGEVFPFEILVVDCFVHFSVLKKKVRKLRVLAGRPAIR